MYAAPLAYEHMHAALLAYKHVYAAPPAWLQAFKNYYTQRVIKSKPPTTQILQQPAQTQVHAQYRIHSEFLLISPSPG